MVICVRSGTPEVNFFLWSARRRSKMEAGVTTLAMLDEGGKSHLVSVSRRLRPKWQEGGEAKAAASEQVDR